MTSNTTTAAHGPLKPTEDAVPSYRPAIASSITGGMWAERRRVNREISIPNGWERLHEAGNFHDLELAAGIADGAYANDQLPFMDSDVYKWAEAAAWALADPDITEELGQDLRQKLDELTALLRAAQQLDGYLDSYFQVKFPGERFRQLAWGHELYCAGHLIQAAIAHHRTTGDTTLLDVAITLANLITATFGTAEGQIDGICGHPEIETALVELYRETGERSYLDTARFFVDRRGHGLLADGHFGLYYFQDRVPVREAHTVEGHAVRQLYLLAGVADLHLETGDRELLHAAQQQWADMVSTKTYITGGIGSHHKDESFGDPYELPTERSYCETCAAIASIMFTWRMLIITGEAKYADLLERTLYNGFLAGVSLDGQRYIYANPLQVRDGHVTRGDDGDYDRASWFKCACCPPNVMRLLASLEHYVVASNDDRVLLHQYVTGTHTVDVGMGNATIAVTTSYPLDGQVSVEVTDTPNGHTWELAMRRPAWSRTFTLAVNGALVDAETSDGWVTVRREWAAGDSVTLTLELAPRFTSADPRVEAVRGQLAIELGPLVYCVESVDNNTYGLDNILVDPTASPHLTEADPTLGSIKAIRLQGTTRATASHAWIPYEPSTPRRDEPPATDSFTAIPYYSWGNRAKGSMRVWLPTSRW